MPRMGIMRLVLMLCNLLDQSQRRRKPVNTSYLLVGLYRMRTMFECNMYCVTTLPCIIDSVLEQLFKFFFVKYNSLPSIARQWCLIEYATEHPKRIVCRQGC